MINQNGTKLINSHVILTSKKIYRIPSYQRAYTWGQKSLKNFIKDVMEKGLINDYYLGTLYVVTANNNSDELFVIDGQQRITTLLLLLNAFRIKYGFEINEYLSRENNKVVLDTYEGTPQFYKLFNMDDVDDIKELHSELADQSLTTSQIIFNQIQIIGLLDEYSISSDDIVNLLKHLLFVNICVDKEIYGYQIFENLNSKGITLSNVDIIKNGLFSRIQTTQYVSPHKSTKYLKWKEIENNMMQFSNVELRKLDKIKKEFTNNLEDMMKFYVQCKTGKKNITKTNYGISSVYTKYLDGNTIISSNELAELALYSKYARFVFYPKDNIHTYTIARRINKYFNGIETLNVKQHRHMSISFIKQILLNKCSNLENEIVRFYKKIVLFHYLFNTISSEIPSKISRVYLDSAISLYKDSLSEGDIKNTINDVVDRFDANLPTKTIIEQRIEKTVFYIKDELISKIKFDKKEYKVYEGKYYGANLFEILESSYHDNIREIEIESIEHILNQNRDINNFENFKLYSMLPLEISINNEMGRFPDIPIVEKMTYLRESNYFLVKEFVNFYDSKFVEGMSDVEFLLEWKSKFVEILFEVYNKL